MKKLGFDYSNALPFISENEIACLSPFVTIAHEMLHNKTGPGSDFTGWVDLPKDYDREEFARIRKLPRIRSDWTPSQVIGIGGSYRVRGRR